MSLVDKSNLTNDDLEKIVSEEFRLPCCNTYPFGKPSDVWRKKLIAVCRLPDTLNDILKYIFDTWCKSTTNFHSRKVSLITESYDKTLVDNFKRVYANVIDGVNFKIKIVE